MLRTSTVDTPPEDSLKSESFLERFSNMSHDERVKNGYAKNIISYISVKDRMKRDLEEMYAKQDHDPSMKDFYLIPYTKNKYKIETSASDSIITKFAIYVPIEDIMANFNESVPQSFLLKGFYGHMDDVYNPKIKEKRLKDLREIRDFKGLQLGDTAKNSLEIIDYDGSR
jgi:hypothetical protein